MIIYMLIMLMKYCYVSPLFGVFGLSGAILKLRVIHVLIKYFSHVVFS